MNPGGCMLIQHQTRKCLSTDSQNILEPTVTVKLVPVDLSNLDEERPLVYPPNNESTEQSCQILLRISRMRKRTEGVAL